MAEEYPHLPECIDGVNAVMDKLMAKAFVIDGGYGLVDVVRLTDVLHALCDEFDVKPTETRYDQYSH